MRKEFLKARFAGRFYWATRNNKHKQQKKERHEVQALRKEPMDGVGGGVVEWKMKEPIEK